jgi:hypothetical protein
MTRPFLLVQLSDSHIGADWGDGDPVAGLKTRSAYPLPIESRPAR